MSFIQYKQNFDEDTANKPNSAYQPANSRPDSVKTMRPPCRQSDNIFNLDEKTSRVGKTIKIVRKQFKLPFRQKSPVKIEDTDFSKNSAKFRKTDVLSYTMPIKVPLRPKEKAVQEQKVTGRAISNRKNQREILGSSRISTAHNPSKKLFETWNDYNKPDLFSKTRNYEGISKAFPVKTTKFWFDSLPLN